MEWQQGDPCAEDMSSVVSGSSAVVSCVGVIGGSDASMEAGNGAVNVAIAKQVQKQRQCDAYSSGRACAGLIEGMGDYGNRQLPVRWTDWCTSP